MAPAHKVRGPLRLLVAIASPETGDGELLDYEAELARIVESVEPARRRGEAYVRILNEGSLPAIAAALAEDPEGFHVLHLSCHARPGELILETPDGTADPVTARRLLEEGVPAGADLPMVVLSGCSTGLAARQHQLSSNIPAERAGQHFKDEPEGETVLASFAAELVQAGVPQVLAMQAPVTDAYATQLAAEVYRHLASDATPDPLLALAEARRKAERGRLALPLASPRRGPPEWATPALLARGLRLPLFNRREPSGAVCPPQEPVLAEAVVVRLAGEFVGRRSEGRLARRTLAARKAGLVIHGIGGVGKSTLAAEVLRSLGEDAGIVISRAGPLLIDNLLDETGARIHHVAARSAADNPLARAALALRAADIEWADRWRLLAEQILPALPMTVLLDNFEDNLRPGNDGNWEVGDPELADLLARWAVHPGRSRLLITSRYPFSLPGQAARRFDLLHLGPLSLAETRKLIWRLPGLDALMPADKKRAYRDVGGHPRALEYLDALLRGQARFNDVAIRMETQLRARNISDPAAWLATPGRDLDTSLAETVTLAASDTLLPTLLEQLTATPLAGELVIGAAVYRVPVDDTALLFQIGQPVERTADPQRRHRLDRVAQLLASARERTPGVNISLEDAGLSTEERAQFEADLAEEYRPPYRQPEGFKAAVRAAEAIGLVAPVPRGNAFSFHVVHRWTAAAISVLHSHATAAAHQRAAAFWRWRIDNLPQSPEQDVEQMLEARYHHNAAGQIDEALALTETAVRHLRTWGQYGRAAELCHDTLSWLRPDSKETAEFTHQLGTLAYLRGDYAAAERSYRQALGIVEPLGDQPAVARSYHELGNVTQRRGDYPAAETFYRQALDIFERLGNQDGTARAYHELGTLAQRRGDYTTAETLYRQALEISEQTGHQEGTAVIYHELGNLALHRGDYTAAETLYRQALDIVERLGNQDSIASVYHQLGLLAEQRDEYAAAERSYRQALEIFERLGNQVGMASVYSQLGSLAGQRGDYSAAETLYRQALDTFERLGDQDGMASVYSQLGSLAGQRGDYSAAETLYRQALDISEQLGNKDGVATNYSALAVLSETVDKLDEAVSYQLYALAIRLEINTPTGGQIRALSELRRKLGRERFQASLPPGLDEESAEALAQTLDDWDTRG